MAPVTEARSAMRRLLTWLAGGGPATKGVRDAAVIDDESGNYLLLTFGRGPDDMRVHQCLMHVEFRDDKVWVHANDTNVDPVESLLDAGIPKDRIVLAFMPRERRELSGFAVD